MKQLKELQDFLTRRKPSRFIFESENQDWYSVAEPCKLQLSFSVMLISENPKMVCLKDNSNILYIDNVKTVRFTEDLSVLGTVITIVCPQITYTIIAA